MATQKHTLVALVEDKPGVLNRMVSLFRRRGFNIESIAVGHSETPHLSRVSRPSTRPPPRLSVVARPSPPGCASIRPSSAPAPGRVPEGNHAAELPKRQAVIREPSTREMSGKRRTVRAWTCF